MMAMADPSSEIMPPKSVTLPVVVSLRLNGGSYIGSI
jgi:hypothetical protein